MVFHLFSEMILIFCRFCPNNYLVMVELGLTLMDCALRIIGVWEIDSRLSPVLGEVNNHREAKPGFLSLMLGVFYQKLPWGDLGPRAFSEDKKQAYGEAADLFKAKARPVSRS